MNFDISTNISIIAVFLQGLLSFLSPCVLPLIPLYMGYLASGTQTVDKNGNVSYKRSVVMINTLFFIIGISFAFFLLGLGFTVVGQFFSDFKQIIIIIGGLVITLFGLVQLGVLQLNAGLMKEKRLGFKMKSKLNPITALIFGFVFSFAWTPCVGPALTSVLLMTSASETMFQGLLLIGIYTIGFVIPFIFLGLFTTQILNLIKRKQNIVKYTVKIGGIILILVGLFMVYMGVTNNTVGDTTTQEVENVEFVDSNVSEESDETDNVDDTELQDIVDFTLVDQNGVEHTLSEYKGKIVFLNFWATWCGPCRSEMPDIQELYEEYGENTGDVVFLGVANPKNAENIISQNQEGTVSEITEFLSENGYTYPTVMDLTGSVFYNYGIQSFPTTFMITEDGKVFGYISGALSKDMMLDIINQTRNGG